MQESNYVLITGASSGLGKDFAFEFAKKGFCPILIARRTDLLIQIQKELKDNYGMDCPYFSLDLTQDTFKSIFNSVLNDFNPVYLINNAGFGSYGDFTSLDLTKQESMIQLNITALTQASYLFANHAIAHNIKAKILNIASISAYFPGPKMNVYYASKAYVHSFSIALNEELKPHQIQVSSLCPGPTLTEFESKSELDQSNLFSNQMVMKSKDVVAYAVRKFLNGKVVIIPGLMNKINALSSRFAPGPFAAKIIAWMSKEKN